MADAVWRPAADRALPLRAHDNGDGTFSLGVAPSAAFRPGVDAQVRLAGDPPLPFLAVSNGDGTYSLATFGGGGGGGVFTTADQPPAVPDARNLEMGSLASWPAAWTWQASIAPVQQSLGNWIDTNPAAAHWNLNVDLPGSVVFQPVLGASVSTYRAFAPTPGTRWAVMAKIGLANPSGPDDRVNFTLSTTPVAAGSDEPATGMILQLRRIGSLGTGGPQNEVRVYQFSGGSGAGANTQGLYVGTHAYVAFCGSTDNSIRALASSDGLSWLRMTDLTGVGTNALFGNVQYLTLSAKDTEQTGAPVVGICHFIRFLAGDNNPWHMTSGL